MVTTNNIQKTINFRDPNVPKVVKRFAVYHSKHPEVYKYFKKYAYELLGKKPNRTIGARLIIERIRYEIILREDKSEEFKISNDYTPAYARLFLDLNPRYIGLITMKSSIFDPYFKTQFKKPTI